MFNNIELVKVETSEDSNLFQKIVCLFFGKRQTLKTMKMYGISFRPPDNSFGIAFKANGYDDETHVMVDYPLGRFSDLEKGELKIGNYLTGSYAHFKADGSIEISGDVDIIGNVDISTGFDGTFSTGTGQTVTVSNGIIINVV